MPVQLVLEIQLSIFELLINHMSEDRIMLDVLGYFILT